MTVPYTFGTATTSIPLSNLDANFNTPITLGNTSIYLGNTTTTIGNLTLTNATISSGTVNITNVTVTTANVTNITVTGTANIATGNVTTLTSTSITDSGLTSGRVTFAGASGLLSDSANFTWNGTNLNILYADTAYNAGLTVTNTVNNVASQAKIYVLNSAGDYLSIGRNSTALGGQSAIFSTSNFPIDFFTDNTQRMTITGTGNVGIGTSNPFGKLDVSTSDTSTVLAISNTNANAGERNWAIATSAQQFGDINFYVSNAQGGNPISAGTTKMTILSNGNVGIGESTPACILDISGATGGQIKFPATQNASSNANTLDDYEEGTWTPGVGNQTVVGTFSSSGTYTKIGRQVTVRGYAISTGTIAGAAGTYFDNLPFACASGTDFPGGIGTNDGGSFVRFFGLNASANSLFIVNGYAAVTGVFFSCTYFV